MGCVASGSIPRTLTDDAEYEYPVSAVWRALTEPNLMGLWLMNFDNAEGEMTTDFQPMAGTSYRLEARKGRGWRGYVVGHVLEVVAQRRLVLTWAHSAAQDARPIRIEFTLEPSALGTHLRMVQSGFPDGIKGWFSRKGAQLGWRRMLRSSVLPVLERSTLFAASP